MNNKYNGGLTREQFLFYEIRVLAGLLNDGLSEEEAVQQIIDENLFQFPTERMLKSIAGTCLKRIHVLDNAALAAGLAIEPFAVAKQINLYAIMRQNRIVWDFMVDIVGEKYRTQDLTYEKKDLNIFFMTLSEQVETVASWSDATVRKIKQVLTKFLVECEYLDSPRSDHLNPVYLCPELESGIRANGDTEAFAAFNFFE